MAEQKGSLTSSEVLNNYTIEEVNTDLLIVGGGMAGCGAAFEIKKWAPKDMKITMVEKAAIERGGAVAQGLSAINTYLGDNQPEDYVKMVSNDLMGITREDLVYDVGRHVDSSVHLFEKLGLPIMKEDEEDKRTLAEGAKPLRAGKWQIMIHGESFKVLVAEAARKAIGEENIYERVFIIRLLMDEKNPNRVAGAIGFSLREAKIYIYKAKAVMMACGGAVNVFRPRSQAEGMGRTWYALWNAGSTYAMGFEAGAEMTTMENRFVPNRFKDGYGPVGAWFTLFKSRVKNAYGDDYMQKWGELLKDYPPYGLSHVPATCLWNHVMLKDWHEGNGPFYMDTSGAIKALFETLPEKRKKTLESDAWEDFLDMTVAQAGLWAAMDIDPKETNSEVMPTEPYLLGSHAGACGMWVSGPSDIAPKEWQWGYNRMTTVNGLFTAGDGVGASGHKFSSGSFTEGRIAGKSAVKFILDDSGFTPTIHTDNKVLAEEIYGPMITFEKYKNYSTESSINPYYISPRLYLFRLNKIMDEYVAGTSTFYRTNEKSLLRGLELLNKLKADSKNLAAGNLHDLMRAWENYHRSVVGELHLRHILFREETRYPGFYYRMDHQKLDEENWRVFVNSKMNKTTGEIEVFKKPWQEIVPKN
ncbi:MAG: adenylyl-sulfate reductase subunit alpha [Candidatus Acididesulfobacter diazotrophicus]|jgi:adenylylsulfate reductase subunit A|uniref:Adenylyl-sulfate reductase subunit alpha n=1 Tax=Candidatus Acididesulfobacter diazotrophicus TaxID=2597226 RepID=A0A519BNH0_9DELT|nr:MAG: adenylyl-sulfate reductase subunit alpha [Candidatus Acididesulfobacter diazotrophicus]